jgi:hypothetical protein
LKKKKKKTNFWCNRNGDWQAQSCRLLNEELGVWNKATMLQYLGLPAAPSRSAAWVDNFLSSYIQYHSCHTVRLSQRHERQVAGWGLSWCHRL